jgi:hypothetical protein
MLKTLQLWCLLLSAAIGLAWIGYRGRQPQAAMNTNGPGGRHGAFTYTAIDGAQVTVAQEASEEPPLSRTGGENPQDR